MAEVSFSDRLIDEARSWIGTPYRHGHATKGAGCDCLGLVRGVMAIVRDEPIMPVPAHSPSWTLDQAGEMLVDGLSRYLIKVEDPHCGDVLVFRMISGHAAKHCGILATPDTFLHVYEGTKVVVESTLVPWWRRRIVAAYRIEG